jgi:ubiquinol-cytochrome c reductase cytochrome c subunit
VRLALVVAAALCCVPAAAAESPQVRRGAALYAQACVSCHGLQGRGVAPTGPTRGAGGVHGAGPPLRGVGARAADFYLRTGYMPLRKPTQQPHRSAPSFSDPEIAALVAYVASLGGGPQVPSPHPERGSLSEGLRLFTENCAGCHQVLAAGGIVTDSVAPGLSHATPAQIAEAVRIGPYEMPRFSQRRIDSRQLDSLVRYVLYARAPDDRGGWAIGHIGPVPEGLVAWLLAGGALVLAALLIGARRPR